MSPLEPKKQSLTESRMDKVVSTHDYVACQQSNARRETIEVEVTDGYKKYVPALVLEDNVANYLVVIRAMHKLVNNNTWTWEQAIERCFPDDVAERLINTKAGIMGNASDNLKCQAAHTMCLKDKTNLDNPSHAQRECMKQMKRYYPQDDYKMSPKQFFEALTKLNDLLPFIDPLNTRLPLKLTDDEVCEAFCHCASAEEEIHAKSHGFIKDKRRFFTYLQGEYDKKQEESRKKKRKAEESNNNNNKKTKFNITNMQGSQHNSFPNRHTNQYPSSNFSLGGNSHSTGHSRGRGYHRGGSRFNGGGRFNNRGRGRGFSRGRFNNNRGRGDFFGPQKPPTHDFNYSQHHGSGHSQGNSQPPYHNSIEEINMHHQDDISSMSQSQYNRDWQYDRTNYNNQCRGNNSWNNRQW